MTCILGPDVIGDLAVDRKSVIDEQLVPGLDISERMNEYAIARLDCLAVGSTRIVQAAGAVAAATGVDHASVGKTKDESVPNLGPLTGSGAATAGYLALVLDEPLAGGDRLQRKESLAMHRRTSCRDASQSHCVVSLA